MKTRLFMLAAALGFVGAVNAEIQDHGDYTLDTDTGFRWIDTTLSQGMTWAEANAEMNPNGDFAGCRFPNDNEIRDLLGNLGLQTDCGPNIPCTEPEKLEDAIRLLGDNHDARLDAVNAERDVAPDGAGFTRGIHDSDGAALLLNDGEYVDRATGEPVRDFGDAVAVAEYYTQGGVNNGLLMICEQWPTNPFDSKVIDFEDVSPGATAPVFSDNFVVTGDATAAAWGGSTVVESSICPDCGGALDYATSMTIARADGRPFAFFDIDVTTFGGPGRLGNCYYYVDGINVLEEDCGVYGTTTWGEKVLYQWGYPSPYGGEYGAGLGPWLNLQSLTVQLRAVPPDGSYAGCDAPCSFNIDNIRVDDAAVVEIDFDPWSDSNIMDPTKDAIITVQITTTDEFSGANVDTSSLRLGPGRAQLATAVITRDSDNDGDADYVYGFRMQDTGITCVQNQIILSGKTIDDVPFAASDAVVMADECFETVDIDVEPFDPQNRVYPDDDYTVQVLLKVMSVSHGDEFTFYPRSASDIRMGPNRAKSTVYLKAGQSKGEYDYLAGFQMEDTGITCDDSEVEIVGLRSSGGYNGPPFPSGAPAFKATGSIDPRDCDTGGCHP